MDCFSSSSPQKEKALKTSVGFIGLFVFLWPT